MRFWIRISTVLCFALAALAQSEWQTSETLPGTDLSTLSPKQKQVVLKLLREHDCSCQCGMKVAECRFKDTNCYYSNALAKIAIEAVKAGKSVEDVKKALAAGPALKPPKLLEDPVVIPTAGAPATGPADAKITLVEFSDFECPYCSKAIADVKDIMAAYPGKIRLIYKQFPLSMHPHAQFAAVASLAARDQGKFWEMHDKLFANFRQLNRQNILLWANQIGLNMDKFVADLDSGKYGPAIQKDIKDGEVAGVYGTPAFFINGMHYNGPIELRAVKPILDAELAKSNKSAALSPKDSPAGPAHARSPQTTP